MTASPQNPSEGPISVIVPLESVAGQTAVGYLKYSSIENLKGNTLNIKVEAIYDSGKIGFEYDDNDKEKALQVMTPEGNGNYITLDYTHSGVIEDISGKAKGSYFRIDTISEGRSSISVKYTSLINTNHTGVLNFTKGRNGSRLENLNHRPVVTLKDTVEAELEVEGASIDFTEITPMVNLNDGPAYTIDTTVTTANVRWQLFGHEEKLMLDDIKENKMILELFKVNELGLEESTGITKEVVISSDNNDYATLFEDLESNTKYGVKLYFIDTSSEEERGSIRLTCIYLTGSLLQTCTHLPPVI